MYTNYSSLCPTPMCDFLEYMISVKEKSEKTVDGYFLDLRIFYRFLVKRYKLDGWEKDFENIDINAVTLDVLKNVSILDLHSFIAFVDHERSNSGRTRARKVACLRSFFKYLCAIVNVIPENPAINLETPKNNSRLPIHLTLNESKDLLNSVDGRSKERDFAIITLFLNCGMRLSELISINMNSFKDDTLTVIGKGNKERTVYLNDACKSAIESYLTVRPEPKEGHENALFLSNRRTRISQKGVQHLVDKYIAEAGLSGKNYSPHKLRHTAATLMYQYGHVDIRALQEILGHESVSTTQIYTHINREQLREAVKHNPLNENVSKEES